MVGERVCIYRSSGWRKIPPSERQWNGISNIADKVGGAGICIVYEHVVPAVAADAAGVE